MALTKIPTHMLFSGAASEDLSIDSNTLYIDSSENRVGIANNSPSVALDVTGVITAKQQDLQMENLGLESQALLKNCISKAMARELKSDQQITPMSI